MGKDAMNPVGVDLESGEPIVAQDKGILDNYCVKKQQIDAA
jgi:T-complex protein 1 subunit zeta